MLNSITGSNHPTPNPNETPDLATDLKRLAGEFPQLASFLNRFTDADQLINDVKKFSDQTTIKNITPPDIPPNSASRVASTLMLAPDSIAFDTYTFMAVFHKMAQEMRSANREIRASETQAQISELNNAAQEMQNAAKSRFAAAVVQGAFQVAGGVTQVAMSTASLVGSFQAAKNQYKLDKMESTWQKGTVSESASKSDSVKIGAHRQQLPSSTESKTAVASQSPPEPAWKKGAVSESAPTSDSAKIGAHREQPSSSTESKTAAASQSPPEPTWKKSAVSESAPTSDSAKIGAHREQPSFSTESKTAAASQSPPEPTWKKGAVSESAPTSDSAKIGAHREQPSSSMEPKTDAVSKLANKSDGIKSEPTKAELKQTVNKQSALASNFDQLGRAGSQFLSGIGGIAAAFPTQQADLSDAARAQHEASAKEHEMLVQHANDMMQQMMEVMRDVRTTLQSMDQALVETNRGIARNV
jgi:hypothetical protein